MRIVHISDLHVLDLQGVHWQRFLSKRLIGAANLMSFRANAHPIEIFEALLDDLVAQNADHIVITGDLSNLSLESEFGRALKSLEFLGGPARWTLIPGNHDAYTYQSAKSLRFEKTFAPWLGWTDPSQPPYPVIKHVQDVVIYGLSSANPSPPLFAWGSVDSKQLAHLEAHSQSICDLHLFSIVLIHHNLHRRGGWADVTAHLRNKQLVIDTLFRISANVVLHGHTHKAHRFVLEKNGHKIPVLGSGSSTWSNPHHPARYNILTIDHGRLDRVECRTYNLASKRFEDVREPLRVDAHGTCTVGP